MLFTGQEVYEFLSQYTSHEISIIEGKRVVKWMQECKELEARLDEIKSYSILTQLAMDKEREKINRRIGEIYYYLAKYSSLNK